MTEIRVILNTGDSFRSKARYVFDTLLATHQVPVDYGRTPAAADRPCIYYGPPNEAPAVSAQQCLRIYHDPATEVFFRGDQDAQERRVVQGLPVVVGGACPDYVSGEDIAFDLVANAFYFLTAWPERLADRSTGGPTSYATSAFQRFDIPRDVVDRYLERLMAGANRLAKAAGGAGYRPTAWPDGKRFAVVLSHDVDFIPSSAGAVMWKGAQSVLRSLIRHRSPVDALCVGSGFLSSVLRGQNPYRAIPSMLATETRRGVRASYQVAVGRRHPKDVNYRIENPGIQEYLSAIGDHGFELCLHGSYLSTEAPGAYEEEAERLRDSLGPVIGSRQHYLSFRQDVLFRAQERAGIRFDMSLGYPDEIGFRSGFSYPFFPYALDEDRPYDVLEIGLFLMDVTLRGYLDLRGPAALDRIRAELDRLAGRGGCGSIVWHPILFGNARDPGYARLFWDIVDEVEARGGLATDGRTVNAFYREQVRHYALAPGKREAVG